MNYTEVLGTEKVAIIIDIGHAYTKCGFSGETGPHSIIPSRINRIQATNIFDYKALTKHLSDEDEVLTPSTIDIDRRESEVLKELLNEFLYRIYYKILNVNSRERKVVIIESILTPTLFRKTLGDVLFNNFQAVSVMFIPSHLAALYTLGKLITFFGKIKCATSNA